MSDIVTLQSLCECSTSDSPQVNVSLYSVSYSEPRVVQYRSRREAEGIFWQVGAIYDALTDSHGVDLIDQGFLG